MASAPATRTSALSSSNKVYPNIISNPYYPACYGVSNTHLMNTGNGDPIDVYLPDPTEVKDGNILIITDQDGLAFANPISIYPAISGQILGFVGNEPIQIDVPYSTIAFQACNGSWVVLYIK